MKLNYLKNREDFYKGFRSLFADLKIPVNYIDEKSIAPEELLAETFKENNAAHQLMDDVFILGMVDDAAFRGEKGKNISEIKKENRDYDGILIFGVTLKSRDKELLPTRSQLAEITRAFNREFHYTPVVVVFKYGGLIALANAERLKYKQEWREGEKAGKVSLLRDIDITNLHSGHERILNDLKIPETGKNKIDSFKKLHAYWQEVFNVNILNKKFYRELSTWYLWAVKEVTFPSEPTIHSVFDETGSSNPDRPKELKQEHNAKNVIRLLTRFLFVWFVKEKKLVPDELFDIDYLKNELLKDLSPFQDEELSKQGLFKQGFVKQTNIESVYYKAILQNLFFASLNCPIEPLEKGDNRKRGFRLKDHYGQHMGADYLMRYEDHFKKPGKFLKLINEVVPFLNGGLFECLDYKIDKNYIDGFSDNLPKPHKLIVPDYLFFGFDQEVDLSRVMGIETDALKKARVKGLITILESYKFTITENTPVEEDVALDPELLGRVFENLLASYNPETKATARKQTGSFYTPREIVNYMVDESLIAYLKNTVSLQIEEIQANDALDTMLRQLLSYDDIQPFNDNKTKETIIESLDNCKILDPACGSGAFPMGILQKMVHVLRKVDPENNSWRELQKNKAVKDTEGAFSILDKKEREEKLIEINEVFDENINYPDYARKLFLVEDCIYGVDIQSVATQISKLRFFIALVVDQKVNKDKPNFGIRALPNLETNFIAANTLIRIDKPDKQLLIFKNQEVIELKQERKNVRHRFFSAKTSDTKRRLIDTDEVIRKKICTLLIENSWDIETAKQVTSGDPYGQNASSPFFDSEWMFDIKDGFDIVIGNPPYIQIQRFSGKPEQKEWAAQNYKTFVKTGDIYSLFYERGNMLLKNGGILAYITSNKWMRANYGKATRKYFVENTKPLTLIDFSGYKVFESATVDTNILILQKSQSTANFQLADSHNRDAFDTLACTVGKGFTEQTDIAEYLKENGNLIDNLTEDSWIISDKEEYSIKKRIEEIGTPLKKWNVSIYRGVLTGYNEAFIINGAKKDELIVKDPKSSEIIKPILRGRDIKRYKADFADLWLINSHNGYFDIESQERVTPINIDDFPAIREHLDNYWEKIEKRQDKGVTPYNLRNCAYLKEFEKEKIVWADLSRSGNSFVFDDNKMYLPNTGYIMTGVSLKYLNAVLNTKLILYYFDSINQKLDKTGWRWINQYVEILPIAKISTPRQLPIKILVDCILFAKENNLEIEAQTLESVIDGMVYDLYFEEEMKKANCYITDRITEVVKPFKEDDTDEFKTAYIIKLYKFCNEDNVVFHGLIHRRNVKVVKIINGADK